MENSPFTRRAFQKRAFHCRVAIRMRETAVLKRRGKSCRRKPSITSLQLVPCSSSASSSTSVASSSFRGICSHRGETPQPLKTPPNSSTRSHFQKHPELLRPAVKPPAAKITAASFRITSLASRAREKNVIKDASKPIAWLGRGIFWITDMP